MARRVSVALIIGVTALVSGCVTGGGGDGGDPSGPLTLTVGYESEFTAYNNSTSATSLTRNQVVLNQVLPSFWEYAPDGGIQQLTTFGSYEKTSDDPLTVSYRINPEAVWSDGEPIDCDDVMLLWAARSGAFPEAGFEPASTSGYALQQKPQCADGERDFTLVYTEPYGDWAAGFGGDASLLPAHIVEQQAQVPDLVAAVEAGDVESLSRAADFWNTGWNLNPGELDPALLPSSGPYMFSDWQAGQFLTLTANTRWWGTAPPAERVVFRYLIPSELGTALRNNDIQVAAPPPDEDVVAQLREDAGTSIQVGDQFSMEQLTVNFNGSLADPQVRRAFGLCVPRAEIVEKLVRPVKPDAEPMQSRFVFPFQDGYQELADTVTDGSYDRADPAAARQLLTEAGQEGVTVRLGYQAPDQRRADIVTLITESCTEAGFVIEDTSSETFTDEGGDLYTGEFDVALFGWAGSSLVTGNVDLYHSVAPGQEDTLNLGYYGNPQVDAWLTELETTVDPARQRELLTEVDRQMWADLATIPLFAQPGLVAHRSQVDGVVFQPSLSGFTWNMQEWRRLPE